MSFVLRSARYLAQDALARHIRLGIPWWTRPWATDTIPAFWRNWWGRRVV